MGPRFVICGEPNSGKSTWVLARAQRGDLVWDFDRVVEALTVGYTDARQAELPPWLVRAAHDCREALVTWLENEEIGAAAIYVIVTRKSTAQRIASRIRAELIELGTRTTNAV